MSTIPIAGRWGRWFIPGAAVLIVALSAGGALESDPLVARIRETPPHEVPLSRWRAWSDELRSRIDSHVEANRREEARDLALFTAGILAGPGLDRAGAVELVRSTRRALDTGVDIRPLFLAESEWLARMGDREAIRRLMDEYRTSPHYRPEGFAYDGGREPGEPLRVRRPFAAGFDDPVMTTMERHARLAGVAIDPTAFDFEMQDIDGRVHRADMYRGRWLLMDFWVHGTVPRRRTVDAIASALRQWSGAGFSVVSICQNLDADALRDLRRRTPAMTWPQVDRRAGAQTLRAFGVFGEIRNMLFGPDGRVVARDVSVEDLPALLRSEIGSPAR